MKIRPLELIIQALIVCLAVRCMADVGRWSLQGNAGLWWEAPNIIDVGLYYSAAHGIFVNPWSYKNFVAVIFKWMQNFSPYEAAMYWGGIQTVCFMLLTHKMCEVKYGWIPVVLVLPQFESILRSGNIQIALTLAAVYPIPALLAVLVKPQHIVFALGLALAIRYRVRLERKEQSLHKDRQPDLRPAGLLRAGKVRTGMGQKITQPR